MKRLDFRNLNCPEPVVRTKNELTAMVGAGIFEVLVDNPAAAENVARFARSRNCAVTSKQSGKDYLIEINYDGDIKGESMDNNTNCGITGGNILFIKHSKIGSGNDELGKVLMRAFLNTVAEYDAPPAKIFFVNSGVTLTVKGADTIAPLMKLFSRGVEIFSCGTCLDYYGLKDELEVGKIGNMFDLVDNLFTKNVIYI